LAISIPRPAERAVRRIRPLAVIPAAVAVLAMSVGVLVASRTSLLHARAIDVGGNAHLSRAAVLRIADISRATNVVWLDEGAVERRLEANPWVADADVRVAWPWTIEIRLVERVPVALATDGLHEVLVAGDGTSLGPAGRTRGLARIQLVPAMALDGASQTPRRAAAAIGAMGPQLRAEVASVSVMWDGSLELRLRGGVRVRYGAPVDVARKAAVLARILTWAHREGEVLSAVNVVAPDHPAVRTLPGPLG
jgi:cell division protein FtsQ